MAHELSPEEQELLLKLVQRQHEAEDAESRLLEKFSSRSAVAGRIWAALVSLAVALVLGTVYVLTMQTGIGNNARDLQQLRLDCNRNTDRIEAMRLEMKDKVDRKKEYN